MAKAFGFIIDPPATLSIEMDTTVLMISECSARGIDVLITTPESLFVKNNKLFSRWTQCTYCTGGNFLESLGVTIEGSTDDLCAILFMRKDPPVDGHYRALTHMLTFTDVRVVNDPYVLLTRNEKLIPLAGPYAIRDTYVSNDAQFILDLVRTAGIKWVIKPLADKGGNGVHLLDAAKEVNEQIVRRATGDGREAVILQRYLDDVKAGDKRIFMLNGTPIGWMNRLPAAGEFRANIHLGATPAACDLSARDLEICEWVNSEVDADETPMIALDIIGKYLSEVNITSPSGIPEINKVSQKALERTIIDYFSTHFS
jgi:glutathione synthase